MTETTNSSVTPAIVLPATMRAATYHRYGPPDQVVTVTDIPIPAPEPAEVLVKVGAASVNALDWHYVTGLPLFARPSLGWRRPSRTIPGADVAGTVVGVGAGVTRFRVGDEVFGQVDGGGFAEYAVTPADWLVARPAGVSREEAATLGVAAETALQGLRDWGGLVEGQRVMVNGASGGVGTFAVQLAKALGASHVTAVCSTPNVETAARIGADRVVDYTRDDATDTTERYDVLFDNAGVWPLRTCGRLLADGGTYVMVTAPKSRWVKPLPRLIANVLYFAVASGRSAGFKVASRSTADLELLSDWAERGSVRPVISRRFTLDEAPEALRVQGEFHARGKSLVLP
jgi:NADPH:quinone reductase-like Zn-dependent oxidoreductase